MQKKMGSFVKDYLQPAIIVICKDDTVEETVKILRKKGRESKVFYFYVVGEDGVLMGTVGTRALLIAELQTKVKEIMDTRVIHLKEDQAIESAMEILAKYRLLALPVTDEQHRLKGIFDIQACLEENVDLLKAQRNQDVFQLIGVTQTEMLYRSPLRSYKKRMPWILCNMIGGIACAMVSFFYRDVLGQVLILAMFIPLVLTVSESISTQSMTHSFQILRKQKITCRKIFTQMFLEVRVALIMAFTSGITVGIVSFFWDKNWMVSAVIAVGITLSVIFSSVTGSCIPLFLHLKKLDPKVASGPVVLTLADIITTVLYLSIASFILL